ncbi:hypothetical protein C4564_05675, partial [Candidatus Microgenomates bacterium]
LSQDMEQVIFGRETTPTARAEVTDEHGVSWLQVDVPNEAGQIESYYCAKASAQVAKNLLRQPINTSLRFGVQGGTAELSPDVTYGLNVNPKAMLNGKEYVAVFKGAKSEPSEPLRVLSNPSETINLHMIIDPEANFKVLNARNKQVVYGNFNH